MMCWEDLKTASHLSRIISTEDDSHLPCIISTEDASHLPCIISTKDASNLPYIISTEDASHLPCIISTEDAFSLSSQLGYLMEILVHSFIPTEQRSTFHVVAAEHCRRGHNFRAVCFLVRIRLSYSNAAMISRKFGSSKKVAY